MLRNILPICFSDKSVVIQSLPLLLFIQKIISVPWVKYFWSIPNTETHFFSKQLFCYSGWHPIQQISSDQTVWSFPILVYMFILLHLWCTWQFKFCFISTAERNGRILSSPLDSFLKTQEAITQNKLQCISIIFPGKVPLCLLPVNSSHAVSWFQSPKIDFNSGFMQHVLTLSSFFLLPQNF